MGAGMARNILRAGHEVSVYNRTVSKADELAAEGARLAGSPGDAAKNADLVITMLADDAAVESVVFGTGGGTQPDSGALLASLGKSKVHVSCSTISVALSRRLADAHAAAGQSYLAAPVFGRPEAAAAAKLWVIVSGKEDVIASCRPVFDAISQGVFVAGVEPEAASVIKISGNFLIASMLEALGETFALIRKSGVEPAKFLEVVTALFRSPIYQNYGSIVAEQKYEPAGFKLKLGLKDVKLAIQAAEGVDMAMPLGSLVRDHYLSAIARGEGDIDWAGLGRVIARAAGLPD